MYFTLQMVMLVAALCLDSFVASIAFGAQKIRIPVCSALLISAIGALSFGVSLLFGTVLRPVFPMPMAQALSFLILAALGTARMLDGLLKEWIRRSRTGQADLRFRFMNFSFLLRVWADSTQADSDHSKELTPRESLPLGVALALDGMAAGFGAGLMEISAAGAALLCFCVDLLMIVAGSLTGSRMAKRSGARLSWLGGVLLLLLAFARLR